ncbi:Imm6 family immunity protein [Shewanella algae]|uniref:Imm6 family immunity protein n=1 Tax=Shewanella algae TaxID=38313 RepID=UPI001F3EA825|nr:Imm6 family immunity protein [Shewanella algae]MCE9786014.1 immunity 6 family protein [Shewanella algae]
MENILDKVFEVSLRGKVSFLLRLSEQVFNEIEDRQPGSGFARSALDMCWKWVEGADVSGDDLYFTLENEDDTGLIYYGADAPDNSSELSSWNTIITSVMYASWAAYKNSGEVYFPQTIEGIDDSVIEYLHQFFCQTDSFKEGLESSIIEFLLKAHKASGPDDLGLPLSKKELIEIG